MNSTATIQFRAAGGAAGGDGVGIAESIQRGALAEVAGSKGVPVAASTVKGGWETFHFSGGLEEYVKFNNRDNAPMHDPIIVSRTVRYSLPSLATMLLIP